jgi:ATP-dependent helicase Lhr and Lhr-like helicase
MSLELFHPAVGSWFSDALGTPTPAQVQGWAAIRDRRHTLIAAPTGSGKTLAAFLNALDELLCEGLHTPLPNEVRVVYVSPLKALSADIHKNLAEPRRGIAEAAGALGLQPPELSVAVRTGDTTTSERAAMLRTPPHILVTTPESLYLMLTGRRSRELLRTARTVIVDEIHAVIGTRRGAHLALTLERLQRVASAPLQRIGLSATQRPIEEVARYLVGASGASEAREASGARGGDGQVVIVDEGHRRAMEVALEMPRSVLDAVMSHEVWAEYYERLTELIGQHKTTLIFVNTRRMAERLARELSERVGEEAVTAHHGSLSKERRLDAENRLKSGQLKALVATASLELGIDIGHIDLVCQIGSPHRIATFLQRVGRSGHTVAGMPKGRLFPVSRDDLIECAALLRAVRHGDLDRIVSHDAPLDVLAQQIVAETACEDYSEDELFTLARGAWPYRSLTREQFDGVARMTSEGFATKRGRRSALTHRDEVHRRLRGRRGARSLAITSGGAIPEVADYRVILDPGDMFIGTLHEDFAIESSAGDVIQLGNASWQIIQVGPGVVRVADAKGAPPTLPFWLGEAPARSDELSKAVSDLRMAAEPCLAAADAPTWLANECGVSSEAGEQAMAYLSEGRNALGVLPTQDTIVLERFFDESGGMQLVLHAPFGSRINKAWGLALRKRFCRQFNFELQAAATEEGLLLSLGPQHSFPLADVFRYLHPATARDVLVQAFLDAPVFQTRWRWNTTISLAVPRNRHGKKVAPQLQRMMADDLMAAVFPDAAACLENIPGDREIPDHPLVTQAVRDCLQEAMDFDGLARILERIHRGEIQCVARDTTEPSPLCHELLNARPYSYLDDAPLEERRTQAVYARRAGEPGGQLSALDPAAIQRVCDEARPEPRDADELHDVLLTTGYLTDAEVAPIGSVLLQELVTAGRATAGALDGSRVHIAAERLPELLAIRPQLTLVPPIAAPATRAERAWTPADALVELFRGRVALVGPTTAGELAAPLGIDAAGALQALETLEAQGVVLRGTFRAGDTELEWCERGLLARIHRYTLNRLRAEIEAVSPADYMRFLFDWQHVTRLTRVTGTDGLLQVLKALDGFEVPAAAWESSVLPSRMHAYDAAWLDMLCLTGQVGWARMSPAKSQSRLVRTTPVAMFLREHGTAWSQLAPPNGEGQIMLSVEARAILGRLTARGAMFSHELASGCGLAVDAVRQALGELVSAGLAASDGFAGLRGLIADRDSGPRDTQMAGRWSASAKASAFAQASADRSATGAGARALTGGSRDERPAPPQRSEIDAALEIQARVFLRRYGVVCRRVLTREPNAQPWRLLSRVYRTLEARGEIRGGRFVAGLAGEQFALPEAVQRLREIRRTPPDDLLNVISAADPLNLAGIVTSGERVPAVASTRLAYRNGVPIAVMEGDYIRPLADIDPAIAADVASALAGRRVPPVISGFVGRVS